MTFISQPGLDKRKYAEEILGGTPSMEDIVQKVAELEYLEEIESYKVQRAAEYPDFGSQLDYIYHNGVDSWKTNIVDPVKAKYAKVEIDTDELASRKAAALIVYQSNEYTKAKARVAQYQLSVGQSELTETIVRTQEWSDETYQMEDVIDTIVTPAIAALEATIDKITYDAEGVEVVTSVANPLIVADDAERAEAQSIIDSTPQPVKDHVDGD